MPFTTWSPIRKSQVALSNGDLTATSTATSACVHAIDGKTSGKFYWEISLDHLGGASTTNFGLCTEQVNLVNQATTGTNCVYLNMNGYIATSGVPSGYMLTPVQGNVVCIAADLDSQTIWFRLGTSGLWNGDALADPATGINGASFASIGFGHTYYPLAGFARLSDVATANFGAGGFLGAVPSGFDAGWLSVPPLPSTAWSTIQKVNVGLSNSNLTATGTGIGGVRAEDGRTGGKYYWEFSIGAPFANNDSGLGIVNLNANLATVGAVPIDAALLYKSGNLWVDGVRVLVSATAAFPANALIGVAVDFDAGLIWFRLGASGLWNNRTTADPVTSTGGESIAAIAASTYYPGFSVAIAQAGAGDNATANFGASLFTGSPPVGFYPGWPAPPPISALTLTAYPVYVSQSGAIKTTPVSSARAGLTPVVIPEERSQKSHMVADVGATYTTAPTGNTILYLHPTSLGMAARAVYVSASQAGKLALVSSARAGLIPAVIPTDGSQKTQMLADVGAVYNTPPTGATIVYVHTANLTARVNSVYVQSNNLNTPVVSSARAGLIPAIIPQTNTRNTYMTADIGAVFDAVAQNVVTTIALRPNAALSLATITFGFNFPIALESRLLRFTPLNFVAGNAHHVQTGRLALNEQEFDVFVPREFPIALQTLTLTPTEVSNGVVVRLETARLRLNSTITQVVYIDKRALVFTARTFAIRLLTRIERATLILTESEFSWNIFNVLTAIPFEPAELLLFPAPFGHNYEIPDLHMTQEGLEVAVTRTAALAVTQLPIEAASTSGDVNLRQTQTSLEASVVSDTAWLHQTQTSIEAAVGIVHVPVRVTQVAVEVLRGMRTVPGWNAEQPGVGQVIVTPIYPGASHTGVGALPGLAYNVKRGMVALNSIMPHTSGKETRIGIWSQSIYTYELTYALLRDWPTFDEYRLLEAFWLTAMGQQGVFLYDDMDDNQATGQVVGIGNGKETQYQLVRTLGKTGQPGWTDAIYAPRAVTAVYLDGHLQDTSRYDVTYWNSNVPGVLAMHDAVPVGSSLTADFSYYWPCRFSEDIIDFEKFLFAMWEVKSVKFQTIKCNNILLLPHPDNQSNAATTPVLPL